MMIKGEGYDFMRRVIYILPLITFLSLFIVLGTGCGPSEEYKKVREAIEKHPKVMERNAIVGEIRFLSREGEKDKDLRFEADLLDSNKNIIGKAEGFRVEGFGTRIFRVRYNDEPEPPPRQPRQRPRRQRPPGTQSTQPQRSSADDLIN